MAGQKDREVVLTCPKQRQNQQQAGAHGADRSHTRYFGVQVPALRQWLAVLPSEPRCGCAKQSSRAASSGFIYTWLCARLK